MTRQGSQLYLNGHPWAFAGLDIYNLNSRNSCWYTMAYSDGLRQAVASTGSSVVRAWFFQSLLVTPGFGSPGQLDWTLFDDTLARAKAAGVRLIVTLTDQWGACEPGGHKPPAWFATDYKTTRSTGWPYPGNVLPLAYRDYVAAIVSRYRNDPSILAWQPVNEPEVCGSNGDQVLYDFTADVTGLIKSIDPNHLVSLGTIGTGQCGTAGPAYEHLHSLPGVDWCEVHDYFGPSGTSLPGDQWNGIGVRAAQCKALGKPLVVGESGMNASAAGGQAGRAQAFAQKMDTYRASGAAGFLIWNWVDAANGGSGTDWGVGPGDPLDAVIGARALTWGTGGG